MENARILVVDDEIGMCEVMEFALEGAGYAVHTAASGPEAQRIWESEDIDVVITDLKMPGMSGIELLAWVRERDRHAAVIIATGHASLDTAVDALRLGAVDYVIKPFDDIDKLTETVARAVEQRRQAEQEMQSVKQAQQKGVISTGNQEIDNKMGGGIPLGSLTLIDGHSHAGKSVLTQQMIWGSLCNGFRLSLFTTENTIKSLIVQMQSLNVDVLDFMLMRRLHVFPMELARSKGTALDALADAIQRQCTIGCDMVFVDALTPLILSAPEEEVVGYFEGCKRVCAQNVSVVNVVHSHAVSVELLVRITSLCDAHLCLRTEEAGSKLVKIMEVSKIRGASRNTGNIISFEIEPGLGMRIIPLSKAQG